MKKHFVTLISLVFSGIILTSARASNAVELKSQISNASAPFHLMKGNNGELVSILK